MFRRIARYRAPLTIALSIMAAWISEGCVDDVTVAERPDAVPPPLLGAPDASTSDAEASTLVSYCPSSQCPEGFTTCPTSRFPCDVNFTTNRNNCGACGVVCPADNERESYECIEGRCVMACHDSPLTLDCDGIVDNGCETDPGSNDNCGACGDKCLDPEKPCIAAANFVSAPKCGCEAGLAYCADAFPSVCVDKQSDDANCGTCGTACDRASGGDGGPPPAHTYYGCGEGECGVLKCEAGYADCDKDMSNGCEKSLQSADDCGQCGNACSAGSECQGDESGKPFCACPAGQTYCPFYCNFGFCAGMCADLSADKNNCGACGFSCTDIVPGQTFAYCAYGTCKASCAQGRADCNGNKSDDCEIDTNSDPRNCGGCGIACDAIAGQACVAGRCVVEPCVNDAGTPEEAR